MSTTTSDDVTGTPSVEEEDPVPPFFNTTFSTHRVSPLYVGNAPLTTQRLEVLGRRLRDTLVGDVVRGIQIGLESTDTPAGQVGPLRSVALRWFRANAVLGDEVDYDGDPSLDTWRALAESQKRGLWIEIRHENAAYVAVLLPGVGQEDAAAAPAWQMQPGGKTAAGEQQTSDEFVHLPLMLLRMPMPLKTVIGEWLAGTFDCRVSKLALGTRTLVSVWEDWIRTVGVSPRALEPVMTLGFNVPLPEPVPADPDAAEEEEDEHATRPGLRSLDITIQAQELAKFVRAGRNDAGRTRRAAGAGASWEKDTRERRRLAGGSTDDGWGWLAGDDATRQPFTDGLARYLDHHLGLNLFHPSVRVTQVSCGGFVLGAARLKIAMPGDQMTDAKSRAAWMFVTRLSHRVKGDSLPTIFT